MKLHPFVVVHPSSTATHLYVLLAELIVDAILLVPQWTLPICLLLAALLS